MLHCPLVKNRIDGHEKRADISLLEIMHGFPVAGSVCAILKSSVIHFQSIHDIYAKCMKCYNKKLIILPLPYKYISHNKNYNFLIVSAACCYWNFKRNSFSINTTPLFDAFTFWIHLHILYQNKTLKLSNPSYSLSLCSIAIQPNDLTISDKALPRVLTL